MSDQRAIEFLALVYDIVAVKVHDHDDDHVIVNANQGQPLGDPAR